MGYNWKIGTGVQRWVEGTDTPSQKLTMSDYENLFILQSGAYRSGKTETGARLALRHALSFDGAKVGVFRNHLASLKKSTLLTTLELLHPSDVADFNNSELTLLLKNGSTIGFYGCEFIDRLGSIELTFAFVDEVSELSREALGMIQGRLSGQLQLAEKYDHLPREWRNYAESTLGIRQVAMATNPKSQGHWLYEDFIKSPKPGNVCYSSNSINNPNLPETYIRSMLAASVRAGISLEWVDEQIRLIQSGQMDSLALSPYLTTFGQRNLLGLWVAMEGAIYDMDADTHLVDEPMSADIHYAAVDWGFANGRIVVCSYSEGSYQFVWGWNEPNQTPDTLLKNLAEVMERFQVDYVYLPPDQPGLIQQAKNLIGSSRIKPAKNAVLPGISVVNRFINQGKLTFLKNAPGVDKAWSEMSGYTWETKDGQLQDKPIKVDDHYPDAIRYLIYSRHFREKSLDEPLTGDPRFS